MYLFLVPASFFLFYLALRIRLKPHPVYAYLRVLSSLVFFLHWWVMVIMSHLLPPLGLEGFRFSFTAVTTLALSLLITCLSRRPGFAFLKKLYS